MDEFLNELYRTSETIGAGEEDVEKTAAAEMMIKLAAEEGVDLDELSDEEVGMLLEEVEKQASGEPEPEPEDEAQEKLAEADFLGRAMAHAYVNELSEIEKQAMVGPQIGAARLGYRRAKGLLGRAAKAVGEATGASELKRGLVGRKKMIEAAREGAKAKGLKGKAAKEHVSKVMEQTAKSPSRMEMSAGAKKLMKRVGAPAVGLGALGTAAAMAGDKDKRSFNEEFEAAAQERAYEILADAGYDVEKVAQADVDTRALQMLEEAGYPVDWNQE